MKPHSLVGVRTILAAAGGALLLGTAASALADASDEPLATLWLYDDHVEWEPKPPLRNKSAVLTVSVSLEEGVDCVSERTFLAGEPITYPFEGDPNCPTALESDGSYKYELYGMSQGRIVAQDAMREGSPGAIDANGRPSNANAATPVQARRGTVQSGYFSVGGEGMPVDPGVQEN